MKKSPIRNYARYTGLAFEMLAIIGVGTYVGYKLDKSNNREFPLFTLIFSLISVGIALYVVIRSVIKNSKNEEDD